MNDKIFIIFLILLFGAGFIIYQLAKVENKTIPTAWVTPAQ